MPDHTTPHLKQCSVCRVEKHLADFHLDGTKKDGHASTCKQCACARARQWNDDNADRVSRRNEDYYQQNRERIIESARKYYADNQEKISHRARLYRARNADKALAYRERTKDERSRRFRNWYLKNRGRAITPEKRERARQYMRAYRPGRRARKLEMPADFGRADRTYALSFFGYCCAVCGRPEGFFHTIAMDHWIPLNDAECPGTIPSNIIPLCHGVDGCNNSKADRPAAAWLISKFGPRKAAAILKRIETYFASLTP